MIIPDTVVLSLSDIQILGSNRSYLRGTDAPWRVSGLVSREDRADEDLVRSIPPPPATSIHTFLAQFWNIDFRWRNDLDPYTMALCKRAARFQQHLLLPFPSASSFADYPRPVTFMTLSLRCLALSHLPS